MSEEKKDTTPKTPQRIHAALLKAQRKFPVVKKDGENPHFKSRYATLKEIWDAVREPLHDAGLAVYCTTEESPLLDASRRNLVTHLVHVESGEEIRFTMPIPVAGAGVTAQQVGSALTYIRRYSLLTLLNVTTADDEDDDGQAAMGGKSGANVADILGF